MFLIKSKCASIFILFKLIFLISARAAWSVVFDLHRFLDLALHVFFVWQFPWRVSFIVVVAIGIDNDVVAVVVFLDLA